MKRTSDCGGDSGVSAAGRNLGRWIGLAVLAAAFATLVAIGCSDRGNPASGNGGEPGGNGTNNAGTGTGGGEANADIMTQNPALPVTPDASDQYEVSEGGTYTDSRNGRTYNTVVIRAKAGGLAKKAANPGGLVTDPDIWGMTWFAENAKSAGTGLTPRPDSLFTWDEATGDSVCNGRDGWYLPSRWAWNMLVEASGGSSAAGSKLKARTGWRGSKDAADLGDSLFNAKGKGYRSKIGDIIRDDSVSGLWWTSESSGGTAYYRGMSYKNNEVIENNYGKNFMFAVRCVQGDSVKVDGVTNVNDSAFITVRREQSATPPLLAYSDSITFSYDSVYCKGPTIAGRDNTFKCLSGRTVVATAIPGPGHQFVKWTKWIDGKDSTQLSTSKVYRLPPGKKNAVDTVNAIFDSLKFTLRVTIKDGGDSVKLSNLSSPNDTVIRPPSGGAVYDTGTTVGVKAWPKAGYRFLGWQGETTTGSDSIKITMDKAKNLTANFQKIWWLTAIVDDSTLGKVTFSPKGDADSVIRETGAGKKLKFTARFDAGTKVLLTAAPYDADSIMFSGWAGATTSKTNPLTLTIGKDTEVTAKFAVKTGTGGTGGGTGGTGTTGAKDWDVTNLDAGLRSSGFCYGSSTTGAGDCNGYGGLYDWESAKAACEDRGMELPTRKDWDNLKSELIKTTGVSASSAGTALKEYLGNLGGYGYYDATRLDTLFKDRDSSGIWWTGESGTGVDVNSAYYVGVSAKNGNVVTNVYDKRKYFFSVRCVIPLL
jgi:uncharacterized protein (TIGR02145 family)/uncharacterized repeat protein (TIGR02543 family)